MFQRIFALTCAAVSLDLLTTYVGFLRVGPRFEQNGIALYLIEHVGWLGVGALSIIACAFCFASFKLVYWNLSLRWSLWLNAVVAIVCMFRWSVVITDFVWLIRR